MEARAARQDRAGAGTVATAGLEVVAVVAVMVGAVVVLVRVGEVLNVDL